jgi:hypothetical protein
MLGYFSNALELITLVLDISIASTIVFQTTFMCSFGNHSFLSVFLYRSTGTANKPVLASIHLVSNCSG